MPVSDFEWKAYQVPGDTGDPLRDTGIAAAAEATVTVDLPDLTSYLAPRDKATVLLQTAAEVEHALLVQNLLLALGLPPYLEREGFPSGRGALSVQVSPRAALTALAGQVRPFGGIGVSLPPLSCAARWTSRRARLKTRLDTPRRFE